MGSRTPTRRRNFDGETANHCKVHGHSVVTSANTAEPIKVPFGLWARTGPRHHVLHGAQIAPMGGAILVDRVTHCKVWALSAVNSAKATQPIDLPFGLWTRVGQRMHKFNHICQVVPMCPHGRTHCRHLVNTIETSVYGGDATNIKLL